MESHTALGDTVKRTKAEKLTSCDMHTGRELLLSRAAEEWWEVLSVVAKRRLREMYRHPHRPDIKPDHYYKLTLIFEEFESGVE